MVVGGMVRRLATMVVAPGLVVAAVLSGASHAQGQDELTRLHTEVSRLHGQGGYAEAIPVAERYVALARGRYGEDHTETATAMQWLAFVYQAQGRYAEAEPPYRRSLAIREKAMGSEHPDVG